ncbi:hypothetical protein SAMN04488689_10898 [Paenibacillus sp. cl6col]|nr:hypothetical protein SAMN04488689_10898 [Paenibacillus sp. cl6col]
MQGGICMNREQSYHVILEAMAKMQGNVAKILEAKAVEAEKMRNWTLNHMTEHSFTNHREQIVEPLDVHAQVVEVIESLTKLQVSLSHNMKVLLRREESEGYGDSLGGGMLNGEFGIGDKM